MQEIAKVCEQAAKIGGDVLLDWRGRFDVQHKGRFDLVTQADLEAQVAIRDHLLTAYPDHDFLGEENTSSLDGDIPQEGHDCRWIVDPLDGTTNYVHHLKNYCVSIALQRREYIEVCTVFDPELGECYTAQRGRGAFLNGERLQTSTVKRLTESLIAGSFPPNVERDSVDVKAFLALVDQCQSLRRLGSAALNLCYVAAGRLDAYWALNLRPWDMAAGLLLVQEAQGVITGPEGLPVDLEQPRLIAAATNELHEELIGVFSTVL